MYTATLETVETDLGVKNCVGNFTAELDGTWAVLGEVISPVTNSFF